MLIEAKTWREMEVRDILASLDAAITILEHKDISEHVVYLSDLATRLSDLLYESLLEKYLKGKRHRRPINST